MALPLAAIGLGASIVGQGVNTWQTARQNRKSRQFSREMYARQKADQIEFWNMQNQYNAPSAEMARLKAAGLNPALMYGSGAQANRAGDIGSPKPMSAQFNTPRIDPSSAMMSYNQTRIADKQMELLDAEKAAKLATAFKDLWSGEGSKFDVGLKEDTRSLLLEKVLAETTSAEAKASMDKMANQIQYEMFSSGRTLEAAIADQMYKEFRNRNLNVQRRQIEMAIQNIKQDVDLKKLEKDMRMQTGQTYQSGTLLGPILRFIKTMVDLSVGYDPINNK